MGIDLLTDVVATAAFCSLFVLVLVITRLIHAGLRDGRQREDRGCHGDQD